MNDKIGFGTFINETKNYNKKEIKNKTTKSIIIALEIGYRIIDSASNYNNYKYIGEAIEATKIPRKDIYLICKGDGSEDDIKSSIEKIFKCSDNEIGKGNNYIDLYLIHHPIINPQNVFENWNLLPKFKQQNYILNFGLSNVYINQLKILKQFNLILPYALEIEIHLYCQEKETVTWCQENNIKVIAQSPLGYANINILLDNEEVQNIAAEHNCTPVQILLAFTIQRNIIPIPASDNMNHIYENFEAQNIKLTSNEMNILSNLDDNIPFTTTAEEAKDLDTKKLIFIKYPKSILSSLVLEQLTNLKFSNIEKYSEGSSSLILKVKRNNQNLILLIDKNRSCENNIQISEIYNFIYNLQKDKILSTEYIVTCYEPILLKNIKLTDDEKICPNIEIHNIPIQVEELCIEVLGKKIYRMLYKSVEEKVNFIIELRNRLIEMYKYILLNNLIFTDDHVGNFAYREIDNINTLIFIDIDSFKKSNKTQIKKEELNNKALEITDYTLYELIKTVFDTTIEWIGAEKDETIDIVIKKLINSETWDAFRGLYLNVEDRDAGLKLLSTKINSKILFGKTNQYFHY